MPSDPPVSRAATPDSGARVDAGTWATLGGVLRSLGLYHWGREARARRARMDALYAHFLGPGDLAFDIGSHVGDRVASFRRLEARVVAVEPQPALAATLRLLFSRDPAVTVEALAVGAAPGTATLHLNPANPTVSTLSTALITAAPGAAAWRDQRWTARREVRVTTLDALIARHGRPSFIKIDVEGLEDRVLVGLGAPVPALSFEVTTLQREVGLAALARCRALGFTRFTAALGESQQLTHGQDPEDWEDADAMERWLRGLPEEANSGDVYALCPEAA